MQRSTKAFLIKMKPPKTGTFYSSNIFIDSPLHSLAGNGKKRKEMGLQMLTPFFEKQQLTNNRSLLCDVTTSKIKNTISYDFLHSLLFFTFCLIPIQKNYRFN